MDSSEASQTIDPNTASPWIGEGLEALVGRFPDVDVPADPQTPSSRTSIW